MALTHREARNRGTIQRPKEECLPRREAGTGPGQASCRHGVLPRTEQSPFPCAMAQALRARSFCRFRPGCSALRQNAPTHGLISLPFDTAFVKRRTPPLPHQRQSVGRSSEEKTVQRLALLRNVPMQCKKIPRSAFFLLTPLPESPISFFTPRGSNSVVECNLAKVAVAGSNPVSRSTKYYRRAIERS